MHTEPTVRDDGHYLAGGEYRATAFLENNPAVFAALQDAGPARSATWGRWISYGIGPEDNGLISAAHLTLRTTIEGLQTIKLELRFSFERGSPILPLEELREATKLDLRVIHNADEPGEEAMQFDLPLPTDPEEEIDRVIDWLTRHP